MSKNILTQIERIRESAAGTTAEMAVEAHLCVAEAAAQTAIDAMTMTPSAAREIRTAMKDALKALGAEAHTDNVLDMLREA